MSYVYCASTISIEMGLRLHSTSSNNRYYYMPSAVSGNDESNLALRLATPSGQDGAILPALDYRIRYGFVPQVYRSCFGVLSHITNPLLPKRARSRWLDIGLVLLLRVYGPPPRTIQPS